MRLIAKPIHLHVEDEDELGGLTGTGLGPGEGVKGGPTGTGRGVKGGPRGVGKGFTGTGIGL